MNRLPPPRTRPPLPALLPSLLLCLIMAGCDGDTRVPPTARAAAERDTAPRTMRVVKVHDLSDTGIGDRDPRISHLIEVDVIDGPDQGASLTLPYDEFNQGNKPPPKEGEVVTRSPADWVLRPERKFGVQQ